MNDLQSYCYKLLEIVENLSKENLQLKKENSSLKNLLKIESNDAPTTENLINLEISSNNKEEKNKKLIEFEKYDKNLIQVQTNESNPNLYTLTKLSGGDGWNSNICTNVIPSHLDLIHAKVTILRATGSLMSGIHQANHFSTINDIYKGN